MIRHAAQGFCSRFGHSCRSIVGCAGFYDECKKEYSLKIWKQINAVFDCLPFTAILEEKILCVHAGRCPNRRAVAWSAVES